MTADGGARGNAGWILYCNRYLCRLYPKQTESFFEMLRFLSLVSPGKAGRGVVQPDADIGKSASRSRDHKEVRYSLQIG